MVIGFSRADFVKFLHTNNVLSPEWEKKGLFFSEIQFECD